MKQITNLKKIGILLLSFAVTLQLTGCDKNPTEDKTTAVQQTNSIPTQLYSFYFPKNDQTCTALIDFHAQPELTNNIESNISKTNHLIQQMAQDYLTTGVSKCQHAKNVTLWAVRIDNTDNYGRPDFKNRINILKINAPTEKMTMLAKKSFEIDTLKREFQLTFH